METFAEIKEFLENPHFQEQRQENLKQLANAEIDKPIADLIDRFSILPYCFTLQCCYGHFVYDGQDDPHNLSPLPDTDIIGAVEYRIAYIAFCIENNDSGKKLHKDLHGITAIDPDNIQFCCAEWFWERQVNSFALQVEPGRFKDRDTAMLSYEEALHIEKTRNGFFHMLNVLLKKT